MFEERARQELLSTFESELRDHTQHLNRAFLALEKEPEPEERGQVLQEAFRAAHSLKGAARAVGLGWIERLSHELEDALSLARKGDMEFSPTLFDLLYNALDMLGAGAVQEGEGAPNGQLETLIGQLKATRQTLTSAPRPTGAAPAGLALALPHEVAAPHAPRTSDPESPTTNSAASVAGRTVPAQPGERRVRRSAAAETLRLPAARLDGLLERLGELVLPRLEVEAVLDGLAESRERIETWQRNWRKVRVLLRALEREGVPARWRPLLRFLEENEEQLSWIASYVGEVQANLAGPTSQLGMLTDDLQTEVKRLRMLPFGSLSETLERTVRDVSRSVGKETRLVLVGADTELDRRVLEEIKDPLVHMLSNAVDHGIEPPEERRRLKKPGIGGVVVAVSQRGGSIVIEVEDDGAGISPVAIRRAALERSLVAQADLEAMGDAEALRLVFLPGLSSRGDVSEVSGRGVGLDVVARNVERLGGQVELVSAEGKGTRFTMTLPLTLATTRAVLIEADGMLYALPSASVERIVRGEHLGSLAGQPALGYEGDTVPIVPLASLLHGRSQGVASDGVPIFVLTRSGAQRAAVAIDRLVAEQEIVVKPLGFPLRRIRFVSGATILGSGRIVPILNPGDLVREAPRLSLAAPASTQVERERTVRVLIADDSLTTRSLERYILEAAGFEVALAGDGAEAYALLREGAFDVLVSDVDMPELDGIALTARLRQDSSLRELPIILVTSLDSADDRSRGLQAGADAYIVKSAFDQDHLLRTIQELVS